MATTNDNLKAAFAGESQANRKYLAFAEEADKEGYRQAAKLFRAAAMAETVHAHAHLRAMGGVGKTPDNLKAAFAGETYEFENMYPPMIEAAKAEGRKDAERSFVYANAVEKVHAELYGMMIEELAGEAETDYHVCMVCGNTVEGDAPDRCDVCNAGKNAFKKVD